MNIENVGNIFWNYFLVIYVIIIVFGFECVYICKCFLELLIKFFPNLQMCFRYIILFYYSDNAFFLGHFLKYFFPDIFT